MANNVPASDYDAMLESAILQRVSRPFIPADVPEDVTRAIMALEVGASQDDQDKVRKIWNDYKVSQIDQPVEGQVVTDTQP